MKADKVTKVARFCTSEEVQRWSSNVGRFVAALHPLLNAEMRKACNACPFRNNISAGGCLTEECPVHQVMHTLNRAVPRTAKATKEIYKTKYSRRSA